jgi:hypothetical protein
MFLLVARGGIEPPTRGFSGAMPKQGLAGDRSGYALEPLSQSAPSQAFRSHVPRRMHFGGEGRSREIPHRWPALRCRKHETASSLRIAIYFGTFCDDSALFPDVDWRSIHPCSTPRRFPGTNQRSPHASRELWIPVRVLGGGTPFHGPDSTRVGGQLELSYTVQASASGRYVFWKFDQLREKRRNTSAFGTL